MPKRSLAIGVAMRSCTQIRMSARLERGSAACIAMRVLLALRSSVVSGAIQTCQGGLTQVPTWFSNRGSRLPAEPGFVGAGENNEPNFLWPKMARLGHRVLDPKSLRKVYVSPFFAFLSQEMRHINFFLGPKIGDVRWGKKFMLKKFMCFFCP